MEKLTVISTPSFLAEVHNYHIIKLLTTFILINQIIKLKQVLSSKDDNYQLKLFGYQLKGVALRLITKYLKLIIIS